MCIFWYRPDTCPIGTPLPLASMPFRHIVLVPTGWMPYRHPNTAHLMPYRHLVLGRRTVLWFDPSGLLALGYSSLKPATFHSPYLFYPVPRGQTCIILVPTGWMPYRHPNTSRLMPYRHLVFGRRTVLWFDPSGHFLSLGYSSLRPAAFHSPYLFYPVP